VHSFGSVFKKGNLVHVDTRNMDTFIFFDIDRSRIDALQDALQKLSPARYGNCQFLHASFEELLLMGLCLDATISPSNCLLFFDNGVDAAYLKAFPNVQNDAQKLMKRFGIQTTLGRPYLPIGSAIRVRTGLPLCPYLIAAPTMFLPEDIRGTQNVRHALWAALRLKLEFGDFRVAVPCMGMGYGKLTAHDCAREIDAAFEIPLSRHADVAASNPGWWYVRKNMACRQPDTYSNTEVQSIRSQPGTLFRSDSEVPFALESHGNA
jgi:O-acetyl-ADP-ribose deacetylase (regulator of RNase III)